MIDPNPYLTGRAIQNLRAAGVITEFFPPHLSSLVEELNREFVRTARDSIPPPRFHISTYEWDLLKDGEHIAGRSQQGWYEYFLASNDLNNLERLLEFFTPAPEQVTVRTFDLPADEPPRINVVTDVRLLQFVTEDPARLLSLTPREFELFTAELLEKLRYKNVTVGQGSKDGGVDVSAFIEHQCI